MPYLKLKKKTRCIVNNLLTNYSEISMIVLSENKKLNAIFKVSKERNLMSSEFLNKSLTIQRSGDLPKRVSNC